MKTTHTVLDTLNGLLRHELTVINQYFLHARMLKNFGYESLGKVMYKQSIQAMKNADELIERIFLLEGLPNLQDLGKLFIGENVEEAIGCDLKVAREQHRSLRDAITVLETEADYVSRDLVERLLDEVEEYIDWLETQQDLIESLSLPNYLQKAVASAN